MFKPTRRTTPAKGTGHSIFFFVGSVYSSWDEILVDTMEDCIAGEWEWEEKEYEINTPTERGVRQGRGTTTVTYAREASR